MPLTADAKSFPRAPGFHSSQAWLRYIRNIAVPFPEDDNLFIRKLIRRFFAWLAARDSTLAAFSRQP